MTKPTLNKFLEDHRERASKVRKRCMTCRELPQLDKEVREFVRHRKTNSTRISFQYFYDHFVAKHYDISFGAVRAHAIGCCGMEAR